MHKQNQEKKKNPKNDNKLCILSSSVLKICNYMAAFTLYELYFPKASGFHGQAAWNILSGISLYIIKINQGKEFLHENLY